MDTDKESSFNLALNAKKRTRNDRLILSRGLSLAGRLGFVLLVLHALLHALLLGLVLGNLHGGRKVTGLRLSALLSLGVLALDVRVGRCNTGLFGAAVSVNKALVDLIALGIDDARPGLVARLEADFAGELSDFIVVKNAAVFVTIRSSLETTGRS